MSELGRMGQRSVVFTGTQQGMTPPQREWVRRALGRAKRLYQGCCTGADEEAAALYRAMYDGDGWMEGFPSNVPGKVASTPDDVRHAPAPPLERNRTMVDGVIRAGDPLCLAAPKAMAEERRSGTWATVRYARKQGVPVFICWPDGTHKYEPARSSAPTPQEGTPHG